MQTRRHTWRGRTSFFHHVFVYNTHAANPGAEVPVGSTAEALRTVRAPHRAAGSECSTHRQLGRRAQTLSYGIQNSVSVLILPTFAVLFWKLKPPEVRGTGSVGLHRWAPTWNSRYRDRSWQPLRQEEPLPTKRNDQLCHNITLHKY